MHSSLGEFVGSLERASELQRIAAPVSPVLELPHITDRVVKSLCPHTPSASTLDNDQPHAVLGGHALLFENVEGSDIPVLINSLGSYHRLEMALGCDTTGGLASVADRIAQLVKPEPPRSLAEMCSAFKRFAPLLRIPPKTIKTGPCQEVVLTGDDIDLTRLPLITCWPHDGDLEAVGYPSAVNDRVPGTKLRADPSHRGRYITFAGIHTIHANDEGNPKPSSHNIGMYRLQLVSRRHLAMHWHMHHDGAAHWRSWKRKGTPMPVAVVLGGESVLPFAAIAPLPPGISELLFAGFLNGRGIRMCPAITQPIRVPANAEIIIEGVVSHEAGLPGYDPRDPSHGQLGPGAFFEGPFGDHTGFYSLPDRYPLLEVTAITMRTRPIFPATIVGLPVQEDYPMGKAVERIFLPLLKTTAPDIEDYDLPTFGAFHNAAFVQIDKQFPLHARRIMHAVWGAGQMSWTKLVAVVDTDLNVHDTNEVMRAIGTNCHPDHDIEHTLGPLDILDHASTHLGAGGKIGLDATRNKMGEPAGSTPYSPPDAQTRSTIIQSLDAHDAITHASIPDELGNTWLLIWCDWSLDRDTLHAFFETLPESAPRLSIVLSPDVPTDDLELALFHWVANMDPSRDCLVYENRIVFDSRAKHELTSTNSKPVRDWPDVLRADDATRQRVSSRWDEYFPNP
ncbi:MAG: UbiD family decarboxylase domain-containing protein [Planctomycetota bacterium]|jgi:4-hydroxy-3-polyprenylbenzoate decarboxylase